MRNPRLYEGLMLRQKEVIRSGGRCVAVEPQPPDTRQSNHPSSGVPRHGFVISEGSKQAALIATSEIVSAYMYSTADGRLSLARKQTAAPVIDISSATNKQLRNRCNTVATI